MEQHDPSNMSSHASFHRLQSSATPPVVLSPSQEMEPSCVNITLLLASGLFATPTPISKVMILASFSVDSDTFECRLAQFKLTFPHTGPGIDGSLIGDIESLATYAR